MNITDLTGEYEDRYFITARGDSRIYLSIARNIETVKFGRKNRFLIDDEDSPLKLAYTLSKPLKLGWSHNGDGVFKFVLQEVNTTDDDNQELGIADYYLHFPVDAEPDGSESVNDGNTPDVPQEQEAGKKVWL